MFVLQNLFDRDFNQCSRVVPDVERVVSYDSDGLEFVSYRSVDYKSVQDSHGFVKDWSLNNLLKSGVNPDFSIHTGNPTRLEGVSQLSKIESEADSILSEIESSPVEIESSPVEV